MAGITVSLVLDQADEEMQAQLPNNVSIQDLIRDILNNIAELRQADASGWGLYNKTRQFKYNAADTLASRSTGQDERLGLIPPLRAGAGTQESGFGRGRGECGAPRRR